MKTLPMTVFLSLPNAQIQYVPSGTRNREKLHVELKYFSGRKLKQIKKHHCSIKLKNINHVPNVLSPENSS